VDTASLAIGTPGLLIAAAMVWVATLAGLYSVRAPRRQYFLSPLLAAVAGVGVALLLSLLAGLVAHYHVEPGGLVRVLLPSVLLPLAGFLAGRYRRDRRRESLVRRGARVLEGAAADGVRRALARGGQAGRLTFAGVAVPTADEVKHFKLLGTTGTGKTTAIRELLNGALARGDRAIVADPGGGYLERWYRPERGDVILNPFEPRARPWDLFDELTHPYHIEQLARAMIPDPEGPAREWAGYARTFFAAVTRQLYSAHVDEFAELYRLLLVAEPEELRALLEGTPAQPMLAPGNERMFGSVRAVTGTALGAFEYLHEQPGQAISVRRWIRDGRGVLFLPYQADQIAALRALVSTWMRLAIFHTLSLHPVAADRERRLWFVIDELDALGAIDGLKDALTRLRKYGGRCVLGFQSIAQVSSTYGTGEAQTMVENCGNTLILRCSASEGGGTARFASQLIGEREILLEQIARTRAGGGALQLRSSISRTTQRVREPALLAAEIEQLPDLSGYLKLVSQPAWLRVALPVSG
jgi:type IV secretory pathway TraG/TraD family ATPase VirD4